MYVCICIYIYIYIYTHTEREDPWIWLNVGTYIHTYIHRRLLIEAHVRIISQKSDTTADPEPSSQNDQNSSNPDDQNSVSSVKPTSSFGWGMLGGVTGVVGAVSDTAGYYGSAILGQTGTWYVLYILSIHDTYMCIVCMYRYMCTYTHTYQLVHIPTHSRTTHTCTHTQAPCLRPWQAIAVHVCCSYAAISW